MCDHFGGCQRVAGTFVPGTTLTGIAVDKRLIPLGTEFTAAFSQGLLDTICDPEDFFGNKCCVLELSFFILGS